MIHILAIDIERSNPDHSFCGLVRLLDRQGAPVTLLWTMECEGLTRINVAFVHGDRDDWSELAADYAHHLSDNIILKVARRQPLPLFNGNPADIPVIS